MKVTLAIMCLFGLAACLNSSELTVQEFNGGGHDPEPTNRLKALRAPAELVATSRALLRGGHFERAASQVASAMERYPGDSDLRMIAFSIAVLQERYDILDGLTSFSALLLDRCPELEGTVSGLSVDAGLLLAAIHGAKTSRDQGALEASVLQAAKSLSASLPAEMVTEKGPSTTFEVLCLSLLIPSYGTNGTVLMKRLLKVAPKDTFVLELHARDLAKKRNFEAQIIALRAASNDRCSKKRKAYLKDLVREAEKQADYEKAIKRDGATPVHTGPS